jgi:hypothetical protein
LFFAKKENHMKHVCIAFVFAFMCVQESHAAFAYAQHVKVSGTTALNVHDAAAGNKIGTEAVGNSGSIVSGPMTATLGGTSYTWYHVSWKDQLGGTNGGWCVDDDLQGDGLTAVAGALPSITVTSPASGDNWMPGSTHTISWTISGDSSQFNYQLTAYSTDGGSTWTNFGATLTPTDTTQSWTIPSTISSSQMQIRVHALDINTFILDPAPGGTSANFTVGTSSAQLPTASTSTASSVSASGATLNGAANPNGTSTYANFQYGATISYGSQTTSTSVGSGTTGQSVNAAVSGLSASSTYHYRMVATSSAGTSYGSDVSFTTGDGTQPSLNVTPSSATLGSAAGTLQFSITNTGTGNISYTTAVSSWLTITSGGTGGNSGTLNISYGANTSSSPLQGTITVTAPGATGSPITINVTQAGTQASTAAQPSFSPNGGTSDTAQTVVVASTTPGSTIYYTTDGSIPTSSSPSIVSGGTITVSASETVTAIASASGFNPSAPSSATFTISGQSSNVPALQSISPLSIAAGSAAFSMTLTGNKFFPNSVVKWSGQPDLTTLKTQTATQIIVDVPASYVLTAGNASITVFNVGVGGVNSSVHTLRITPQTLSNPLVIVSGPTATPMQAFVNQSIAFSAVATDVNGDSLFYLWDFGDGTNFNGSSVTHIYNNPGPYPVMVTVTDGRGGSALGTVTVTISDPPPPAPGFTLYNNSTASAVVNTGTVFITADAEMPDLVATFQSTSAPSNVIVDFTLKVTYKDKKVPKHQNNDVDTYTGQTQISQPWSIRTAMGNDVRGGTAILSYKVNGITNGIGSLSFNILATPPEVGQVESYIKELHPPWYALGIWQVENALVQFLPSGYPVETFDGGFGIYKITSKNYVTPQIKWSWKSNCKVAISNIMADKNQAAVTSLSAQKALAGGIPIPDKTLGGITFSDVGTPGSRPMADGGSIKLYNGQLSYINSKTAKKHNFVEFDKVKGWQFYSINTYGKPPYPQDNYVARVCQFSLSTK